MVVGVDPLDLQGRGLGTALVKEGLERADRDNVPCCLDTAEERDLGSTSASASGWSKPPSWMALGRGRGQCGETARATERPPAFGLVERQTRCGCSGILAPTKVRRRT